MTYKGKFKPKNPTKYQGDIKEIVYRSSWELKMMKYCDTTKSIIEWGSEELVIPYVSPWDGRYHRYFPDFYIKSSFVTFNRPGLSCIIILSTITSYSFLCIVQTKLHQHLQQY